MSVGIMDGLWNRLTGSGTVISSLLIVHMLEPVSIFRGIRGCACKPQNVL